MGGEKDDWLILATNRQSIGYLFIYSSKFIVRNFGLYFTNQLAKKIHNGYVPILIVRLQGGIPPTTF